jgi:hypothetical protein
MGTRKETAREEIGVHREVLTINVDTRSVAKLRRKQKRNLRREATKTDPIRERRSELAQRLLKKMQLLQRRRRCLSRRLARR